MLHRHHKFAPSPFVQVRTQILDGLSAGVAPLLARMYPAEIANLLESLPPGHRMELWRCLDAEVVGEVLMASGEEVRAQLIDESSPKRLAAAMARLDMDKLVDLLDDVPAAVTDAVVRAMHEQRRKTLDTLRAYPDDSAGGLMDQDAITVRSDVTLDVVLRFLRRLRRKQEALPDATDSLMVVDLQGHYEGVLSLIDAVSLDLLLTVANVMQRDVEAIQATMKARKVARIFQDRNLVSAPVVDDDGRLVGRITIDDMVDVIRDEAEHNLLASAGLDEEMDMFAPVWVSARRRAVWLGANLLNAFVAAWVIGRFGGSIEQMVALAVLMPVVASMGGVAGNQTLTLVTRGLALDQIGPGNLRELLHKELGVALLNGLFWAVVVGAVATAWFGNVPLGLVFGVAILINLTNAAVCGTLIPLALVRLGIDPALAGGVLLTALTDVIGFAAFLAMATVFIL
jgi:magnesium transporter